MGAAKGDQPTAEPRVTFASGRAGQGIPDLRILHYNDVYHVDASSAEPVGGLARFMTVVKEYQEGEPAQRQPKAVTLFSGDAFNPSLESSVTKGVHSTAASRPYFIRTASNIQAATWFLS